VNLSQVSERWISPRTSLQPPTASVGNMYLQRSHRTSGVGAERYCAAVFESPQIVNFVTSFADHHYRAADGS
jgi:hypothetical protein